MIREQMLTFGMPCQAEMYIFNLNRASLQHWTRQSALASETRFVAVWYAAEHGNISDSLQQIRSQVYHWFIGLKGRVCEISSLWQGKVKLSANIFVF